MNRFATINLNGRLGMPNRERFATGFIVAIVIGTAIAARAMAQLIATDRRTAMSVVPGIDIDIGPVPLGTGSVS